MKYRSLIALAAVGTLVLAACGDDDDEDAAVTAAPAAVTTVAPAPEETEAVAAETTEAMVAETTAAMVAETTAAMVAETTEAMVAETTEAMVAETTEAVTAETTAAMVVGTTEAVAAETTEAMVAETTEAVVETTEAMVVETTEAPVETTEPPVETTEAPVETTEAPVETTEAPVETTEAPVETTEAPVETTEAAVETTEAPVETTEAPVETTEAAVETTEAPIETTEAPVETTEAPIETTEAPVETTEAPIETTEAPVETTEAPVETTEAPVETTEAPVETTEAPVETTEAPVETTEAPVETTEAPVETTEAPVETTEAPVETTEAPEGTEPGGMVPVTPGEDWPEELTLTLTPSQEAGGLVDTAEPLAEALEERLGVDVLAVEPTDYEGVITALDAGQAQIAGGLGPLQMVRVEDEADAELILQAERFGSFEYVTQWFTNDPDTYCGDDPVADPETGYLFCNGVTADADASEGPIGNDAVALAEGATVAFVDEGSTSGYLVPALQLLNAGVDPIDDVTAVFAGGHDAAVQAVYDGDADVGVSFNDARDNLVETTPDVGEQVVVFAWSAPIPNDGFAVAGDLPDDLKEAITAALVDIASTEEGQEVLSELYSIDGVRPVAPGAYDIIVELVTELSELMG